MHHGEINSHHGEEYIRATEKWIIRTKGKRAIRTTEKGIIRTKEIRVMNTTALNYQVGNQHKGKEQ